MLRLLTLVLSLLAFPVVAEEVVAGLSQNRVAITANFDGSEIIIFGAVKRESPAPADGAMQVVITVSGPSFPVEVRKKDRQFGIWVNTSMVEVDSAPSFYAVATSTDFQNAISDTEDLRHHISIPRAIRSVGAPADVEHPEDFTEALIRIRTKSGLYQLSENSVTVSEDTLFQAAISLPANLTEGPYDTRIFLTRNGAVVDQYETVIDVQKVGLERFLYNLAHEKPLIYGLMSLAIAIIAGWSASAIFAYIRG